MRRGCDEEGKAAQESAAKRRNVEEEKTAPAGATTSTATATAFSRVRKGKLVMKGAKKAASASGKQRKEHTAQSASERLDERCRKKGDRHCR